MIVVEQKLSNAFLQLPQIDGFSPIYKWGNEKHLLIQLKVFADADTTPYPLIYQTSNNSKQISHANECETRLRLVLACQNLDTTLLNENRWAMSYQNILYPLVESIEKIFRGCGIFTWQGEYELTEFPNYGNGEENKTADIWDAVVFETTININDSCINTINFN